MKTKKKSSTLLLLLILAGCSLKNQPKNTETSDYKPLLNQSLVSPENDGDQSNPASQPGNMDSQEVQQLPTASP